MHPEPTPISKIFDFFALQFLILIITSVSGLGIKKYPSKLQIHLSKNIFFQLNML